MPRALLCALVPDSFPEVSEFFTRWKMSSCSTMPVNDGSVEERIIAFKPDRPFPDVDFWRPSSFDLFGVDAVKTINKRISYQEVTHIF